MPLVTTERPGFLLAKRAAHLMSTLFAGATRQDVAEFLKAHDPGVAMMFPDLDAAAIQALQREYSFLPQWERCPAGQRTARETRDSLRRFARIPLHFPLVQQVVDKYRALAPFARANVLFLQQILGQAYPQVRGCRDLGLRPENCLFVGVPYHPNPEVVETLRESFGIEVRMPEAIGQLYPENQRALADMIEHQRHNGLPCLVVCSGPGIREHVLARYPELAHRFCFTEQTSVGDRPEHRANDRIRVVSYARTQLKAKEADFIGQSLTRAANDVFCQMGTGCEEKPVGVLGFGTIGQSTAAAFQACRAHVYVHDPAMTPAARAMARERGYVVVDDARAIARDKFLLAGCTGFQSIGEAQIRAAASGTIFMSCSFETVEIDMSRLRELCTDANGVVRRALAAEVNSQKTWHYWLSDGTIRTVIAEGMPANFNDINVVPPEFIDLTMALSLAAGVQAIQSSKLCFEELNPKDHEMLYDHFRAYLRRLDPSHHADDDPPV